MPRIRAETTTINNKTRNTNNNNKNIDNNNTAFGEARMLQFLGRSANKSDLRLTICVVHVVAVTYLVDVAISSHRVGLEQLKPSEASSAPQAPAPSAAASPSPAAHEQAVQPPPPSPAAP
jgi:hypothetical protein